MKLLLAYAKAGVTDTSAIISIASSRGRIALAEAIAALSEAGRLNNAALVIVPAEPPGKQLCSFIRKMIPLYSKVIVAALQSTGRLAPGNFDRLLRTSMPDAESKIKVIDSSGSVGEIIQQAEANGLYAKGHSLQVFCDNQLARNFEQEISDGSFKLDPTTISVNPVDIPKDDADAILKAVNDKDLSAMHRVLDPHVFSSPEGVPEFRTGMLAKENKFAYHTGGSSLYELAGTQAAPQAGAGSQMRGMGSSAWSGGRAVLKAPINHVPEDENASERDQALDQDIRGAGLDWGFGRRNGSSV